MNKKNIFIIIIIIFLLIAGVILMFLNKEDVKEDVNIESGEDITKDIPLEEEKQIEEKIVDPLIVLQKQLENRARFFIERYNTYSSDSNQENLRSLLPQASDKLAINMRIRLMEETDQNDFFSGFQTKVLSIILSEFINDEKAVFKSQVQEQEIGEGATKIHYKTIILEFIYKNEEWKVDSIALGN